MSIVERAWWAAHSAAWSPSWAEFQALAIVLGGAIVHRASRPLLPAFLVGVVLAMAGAVALGCGEEWLSWVLASHGARGRSPDLELAGFGAIGGLLGGYLLVARRSHVPAARALDALAPAIGGMVTLARLGCFFAGCDFGAPTSMPWALRYPPLTPAFRAQLDAGLIDAHQSLTLPVHPTQLYESVVGVVVFAVAVALRKRPREGERFAAALATYAIGRILVDLVRGDLAHGGALGLTTTQGFALALLGLLLAWRGHALTAEGPRHTPRPRRAPR